jgi:hypothetical protein
MSLPALGDCGCSCSNPSCDFKVLVAVIPVAATADDTGSYCPGTYTCYDGVAVTSCSAISNITTWLTNQWTAFQNSTPSGFGSYGSPYTGYAWNTFTTAFFTDSTSTVPYSITGPGASTGYGSPVYGSNYTDDYPLVALNGASAGSVCAYAQLVGMNMTGNLFITPLDVPGKTESCLWTPPGPYYIPLPPFDLCAEEYPEGGGIQIAYLPFQTDNSVDCLPAYTGGTYSTCASPDPFFGSDPP